MKSIKKLQTFFDENIDIIKVIFFQTLLFGILVVNNVNIFLTIAILGIFYALIIAAKRKYYLPFMLLFIMVSMIFAFKHNYLSDKHYCKILNERDGAGEFTLISDDMLYVENSVIDNGKFLTCKLKSLKLNIHDDIMKSEGKILVYIDKLQAEKLQVGTEFKVTGSLSFVEENRFFDAEDNAVSGFSAGSYRKYLNNLGIYALIYPDSDSYKLLDGEAISFKKGIAMLRDFILDKTLCDIEDRDLKNITAALFFGCKGALDGKWKSNFVQSGTIHLFAVSGMHVSTLFLFLLYLFGFLPFRTKYFLAIIPVFLFTIATGANVPAVRAFLMILCFVICRGTLRKISNINILMISAILLIIFNPYNLTDIGFLYSFGITGILLLLSERMRDIYTDLHRERDFMPEKVRYLALYKKFLWNIVFVLSVCVFAFLSGSAIGLYFFGTTYIISLLVNSILAFSMSFVSLLLFGGGVLSICAWHGNFIIRFFEQCMRGFLHLCEWASLIDSNLAIARIGIAEVCLFYFGLFMLLLGKKMKFLLLCLGAFVLMIVGIFVDNLNCKSGILVLKNSEQEFSFCLYEPNIKYAILYNPADFESSQLYCSFLAAKGIKSLDYVVLDKLDSNGIQALNSLSKNLYIHNVCILQNRIWNERKLISELSDKVSARLHLDSSNSPMILQKFKKFSENSQKTLEYFNNATNFNLKINYDDKLSCLQLELNGEKYQQFLEQSNLTEFYNYEAR
ncbi:MAG: ComEC/Rec2 family competence protein [Lentisphaeria bacterium]|nr:ComEC/Rec2 family competence protein [Lentisphaeria bacterium]